MALSISPYNTGSAGAGVYAQPQPYSAPGTAGRRPGPKAGTWYYPDENSPTGETLVEGTGSGNVRLPNGQEVNAAEYFNPTGRGQNDSRFYQAMRSSGERADTAYDQYQGTRASEIGAADALGAYTPAATQGFQPTALEGVSTTDLRGMRPAALENYSTAPLDTFDSETLRGVDVGGTIDRYAQPVNAIAAGRDARTYGAVPTGENLTNVDLGGAETYDPYGAVQEYARGAWGNTKLDLMKELDAQEAAGQRAGRFSSGFFDRDRGLVISDVTNRFSNALAQTAVQAAGIKAGLLGTVAGERGSTARTGAQLAANARLQGQQLTAEDALAADKDRLAAAGYGVDLAKTAVSAGIDRASGIDANRLSALTTASGNALTRARSIDDFSLDAAKTAAGLDLDRASTLDKLNLDRANTIDAETLAGRSAASDARSRIATRDADLYTSGQGSYLDQLAAADDRDMARRNAKAAAKQNRFQNAIGAAGAVGALIGAPQSR